MRDFSLQFSSKNFLKILKVSRIEIGTEFGRKTQRRFVASSLLCISTQIISMEILQNKHLIECFEIVEQKQKIYLTS